MSSTVLLERDDHCGIITINRPEQRNALNTTVLQDLAEAFRTCLLDNAVHVIILTGAGDRAFCAGADLNQFVEDIPVDIRSANLHAFVDLFSTMHHATKPIIGAVQGHALAGGFGLALSCDIVIAAEHATFGTPEIGIGLWPMMIMSIINRHVGPKRAMELYLTGRRLSAEEACSWGLVNRVVPGSTVLQEARSLASTLEGWSPSILSMGRSAFQYIDSLDFDRSLEYLHGKLVQLATSSDAQEGARAFLEKRTPKFS
ncbi:MAG: enoyl-CoA hydratase/isomerase family protein [Candidatus Dormibacteria bacterium]